MNVKMAGFGVAALLAATASGAAAQSSAPSASATSASVTSASVQLASVPLASTRYAARARPHIAPAQFGTCDGLWTERNDIYRRAGYCFKTRRAIQTFGNSGCQYDHEADVPLSHVDRSRIAAIRAMERDLGCTP